MIDKPTYEEYYENGSIHFQEWCKNGKLHRTNGLPARIWYYKDGTISYKSWWKNGKLHRPNGLLPGLVIMKMVTLNINHGLKMINIIDLMDYLLIFGII